MSVAGRQKVGGGSDGGGGGVGAEGAFFRLLVGRESERSRMAGLGVVSCALGVNIW